MHPLQFLLTLATIGLAAGPLAAAVPAGPPLVVEIPVILYDGKAVNHLKGFYTWLEGHAYQDPNRVFTVVDQIDGAPAIRISGEDWGGLVTHDHYRRYKLVAEFRWGPVTSGKRKTLGRNNGVLIHCQGADGNFKPDLTSPWLTSIEYEILEGRTGDAVLVPGYPVRGGERVWPSVTMRALPNSYYWNPQGAPREFSARGKHLHWFGKDPNWTDVLGFRGKNDIEKPVGQWNRIEAWVDGGNLTYFLNGVKVMELTNCTLTSGRLLIQSESAEIYYRRIELHPLGG